MSYIETISHSGHELPEDIIDEKIEEYNEQGLELDDIKYQTNGTSRTGLHHSVILIFKSPPKTEPQMY